MIDLKPPSAIFVPPPRPDHLYSLAFLGENYSFRGLKCLLAAADASKAGDRHAGLAAKTELQREAARSLLASLSLDHLYHHPLCDDRGEVDEVMRVNYDIDMDVFAEIAPLSVGELKDLMLRSPGEAVARIGRALTGVMAAALAKLCDVHELVYLASKISRTAKARTTLGLPGTLASRLQPNHPTDDPDGISALLAWGLSIGAGDAMLGLNPAVDTVENVSSVLRHLDGWRQRHGVPTQICVPATSRRSFPPFLRGLP